MHENVISRIGMCMPTRSCEEMFEPYINGRDPKKKGFIEELFHRITESNTGFDL